MIKKDKRTKTVIDQSSQNKEIMTGIIKSQQQCQATIDAVTDYIFVVDKSRFIKKANIAFSGKFGKHPRDLIGMKVNELFQLSLPHSDCVLDRAMTSESPVLDEVKIGDDTFMISIFQTEFDLERVFVCIMKNITEMKKLRDQIHNSYKLVSIGQLVSGVAHEINNPLTGILGYTELLTMKTKDDSIRKELSKIYAAAERCKKIVDSLLCFSRQQVPQKSLEYINDIMEKTLDLRAYWFKTNNVELVREYGDLPLAYVDIQQIQQALLNILMNAEHAVESSGRNGRIILSTKFDQVGKTIIIKISDNGMGISREYIGRIFDPFFTTKPVGQGTGLGLSITYGIIIEHGGTIRAESREGEGTTFVIELPLQSVKLGGKSVLTGSPVKDALGSGK